MVLENLKEYNIILASGSPRRQELLSQLGIDYEVVLRTVSEDYPAGMGGEETGRMQLIPCKDYQVKCTR
jgi:septum formation protein